MELLLPFLHLIFIILIISSSSSSHLQPVTAFRKHDNNTDFQTLLHFRAQADPHGVLAANWTANASFCSWVGVYCSNQRRRVMAIELYNLDLQEYATAGAVSRMGDVYSFGILLLETFTGKKPVDSMFGEQSSLREWICKANSIMDVLDKNILKSPGAEIDLQKLLRCLPSIIELGMVCSKYSPKERIPMTDVAVRLQKIKMDYLSS